MSIGIKPNLVVAKPSSAGATTSPELVESVILYLHSKGFENICIMESSSIGVDTQKAFAVCGYTDVSRWMSICSLDKATEESLSEAWG